MQTFSYRGRTAQGNEVSGTLEASNAQAAAIQLQNQSIVPVAIRELEAKPASLLDLNISFRKKVKYDDLIMLCRQMRALTRAGVPIIQAIAGLADISKSDLIKEALSDINVRLATGSSLANAMGAHSNIFNTMFVSMIHVGENTGRLEDAFSKLISHIEMERDTRNRMTQAMRYPMFVVSAMFIALMIVNMFVIPQFAKVFTKVGAELPVPTQILVTVSNFTVDYWWLVIGTIVGGSVGFVRYIDTESGRLWWDEIKMKIPIIGSIFEKIALSRFARSFAMTFESGVPVLQALSIVGPTVGNEYIASHIDSIRRGVERGDSLARTSSAAGIFSDLVVQMITIGEETGSLDRLLHDVADFYDEEVDYDLKGLADAIEPIILVFLGILVLVLALGVFLPMWELGSAMKR
ncbi:MAG: MSHA biogenesis protein MshG [Pseudomonadales bacterium]|jgi:MSHA biogenesis protein MshG|uniref:type II secretion system F family protein n=1 Tax=unclassified Ketobacter TaxID=2639109 RepID=UPI000C5B21BB|nr:MULTISPECIES: type II secretion system F family protein [unclassified Ketobacter]MAA60992.1 MSHA biogenesis protein MshG [Pseudomonadales bacterium]MEC8812138.1 type II secretion system F family protein [Pseudomonadota bacterium]TNC85003.1 MAG: MSHA biogenesis protein MshG [Alcanivorax sp.]HAG95320.1 MSHA biogenesis protein MshG [Gammaproteobacteria bacterium]MAQ22671.1 MSHA biogenesis protein MshG [Pseudomonadales bacterium]|tara:strand:- start:454 stop:1674 length:1221 start_codon:yes stop_codon:yes gene_type:complete